MKRFILTTIALGVAALLFSGCHHAPPPPPKPKVVKVKPEPKPKPVKPVKEARPGTPAYLDAKNGFRDLTFGTPSSSLPDLVLEEEDPAHELKTYVRSNDDLALINVPLKKIEYTFFDDRLCEVTLTWEVRYPSNTQRRPTTTELSGYCTTLYGRPLRRRINKDGTFYVWHGQKCGVMLTEDLMPGVPDIAQGGMGWSIPPTTSGEMVIYSEPLRRASALLVAKQNGGGL